MSASRTCRIGGVAIGVIAYLFGGMAWAHKPVVVDGEATDADTAYVIAEPQVSQVGYHRTRAEAPELWFRFNAEAGDSLYLSVGVPKINGLEGVRPAMALLGPGLPEIDVPFAIPDGYGGVLFSTEGVEPEAFYETFTGTWSWTWPDVDYEVQQSGQYYLVGFVLGSEGKFWMAIGTAEQFGLADIIKLPQTLWAVRTFHEVFPIGGLLGIAVIVIFLFMVLVGWIILP